MLFLTQVHGGGHGYKWSLCRRVGRGGSPLPGGDSEDTLWNPHLPQEGVEAALLRSTSKQAPARMTSVGESSCPCPGPYLSCVGARAGVVFVGAVAENHLLPGDASVGGAPCWHARRQAARQLWVGNSWVRPGQDQRGGPGSGVHACAPWAWAVRTRGSACTYHWFR